jgi:cytochrome c oxidase assembly factor CtaG
MQWLLFVGEIVFYWDVTRIPGPTLSDLASCVLFILFALCFVFIYACCFWCICAAFIIHLVAKKLARK